MSPDHYEENRRHFINMKKAQAEAACGISVNVKFTDRRAFHKDDKMTEVDVGIPVLDVPKFTGGTSEVVTLLEGMRVGCVRKKK